MSAKKTDENQSGNRRARSPKQRESQMVALAVDLAERQLREGTASTQVIVHYLKLATERERLEREMLEKKTELVTARTEAIKSEQRVEQLYSEALDAMRLYSGNGGANAKDEEL